MHDKADDPGMPKKVIGCEGKKNKIHDTVTENLQSLNNKKETIKI